MTRKQDSYLPGDRVIFRHPVTGIADLDVFATVVGKVKDLAIPKENGGEEEASRLLVCTDLKFTGCQYYTKYTGKGHGLVLHPSKTPLVLASHTNFHKLPRGVVVVVTQGFDQDDVHFNEGEIGRLVSRGDGSANVSWFENREPYTSSSEMGMTIIPARGGNFGRETRNRWRVPLSYLEMGFCNELCGPSNLRHVMNWPSRDVNHSFNVGDLAAFVGERPVAYIDGTGMEDVILRGGVVKLLQRSLDGPTPYWSCRAVGRCNDSALGVKVAIGTADLAPFEDPTFFCKGQKVEIVAEVDFKKKSLRGKKGTVVLATDQDGDVGIEFPDNIGAGSLDGAGTEGHCVYIEAQAVRSSEKGGIVSPSFEIREK
jgi:hypothetical protein